MTTLHTKEYLGDGAYAEFDGYHVVLSTENGIETTNRIGLEPNVLAAFECYVEQLKKRLARKQEAWETCCVKAEEILLEAGEEASDWYSEAAQVGIDGHDQDAIVVFIAEHLVEAGGRNA